MSISSRILAGPSLLQQLLRALLYCTRWRCQSKLYSWCRC